MIDNAVNHGGHEIGLRCRCLLAAYALNPFAFDVTCGWVVQVLAIGKMLCPECDDQPVLVRGFLPYYVTILVDDLDARSLQQDIVFRRDLSNSILKILHVDRGRSKRAKFLQSLIHQAEGAADGKD